MEVDQSHPIEKDHAFFYVQTDDQVFITSRKALEGCLNAWEKLFVSGDGSDIVLVTAEHKKIHAHKFVLAVRSPIFAAMFPSVTTGQREVSIDLEYKVAYEFLRFLYSGRVHDIENLCCKLLAAANLYEVQALKDECERWACESLRTSNAIELFKFAHVQKANHLKREAAEFVVDRAGLYSRRDDFKVLDGELKDELLAMLAERK